MPTTTGTRSARAGERHLLEVSRAGASRASAGWPFSWSPKGELRMRILNSEVESSGAQVSSRTRSSAPAGLPPALPPGKGNGAHDRNDVHAAGRVPTHVRIVVLHPGPGIR
jgi:hypothetical protein